MSGRHDTLDGETVYEDERTVLLQGDALRVLAGIPNASIDLILADPPYSSGGVFRGDRAQSTATKYLSTDSSRNSIEDFTGDVRDQRAYLAWSTLWLSEAYRVLKPEPAARTTGASRMKLCPGCGALETHGCVIDLQDLPRARHLANPEAATTLLCVGHERPYWLIERPRDISNVETYTPPLHRLRAWLRRRPRRADAMRAELQAYRAIERGAYIFKAELDRALELGDRLAASICALDSYAAASFPCPVDRSQEAAAAVSAWRDMQAAAFDPTYNGTVAPSAPREPAS